VPAPVYDAILESGNYRDPDASPLQTVAPIGDDQRGRARQAVGAASEIQAENPVALDVREVTAFADTFVLLTGRSNRQVKSIADAVARAMSKNGEKPLGVEGYNEGRWVLMDFADLIVHIFGPDARQEYDLERLWSDAPRIDLGLADFYPSAEAKQ
jgi:ribosome-associated protein